VRCLALCAGRFSRITYGPVNATTATTTRKPPRTSAHPLRLLFGHGAEGRPGCHQSPAALEQVGAVIGGDRLVAHGVRQRHFGNLGREVGALSRPIAEARPKSVRRHIAPAHPPQQHQERHVAERSAIFATWKHKGVLGMTMRLHLLQDGERANG